MKKEFTKAFKEQFKEQEKEKLLNKKAEAFLERFKNLSPAEQEKCLKKLNYEMGLIQAKIKDAEANMPSYHAVKLTEKQETILNIVLALVVGSSVGGLTGTITKTPAIGVYLGLIGTCLGYCLGVVGEHIIKETSLVDFFRDLKAKRLDKKIIKHQAKQLKLAKRLELIKQAKLHGGSADIPEIDI